MLGARLTDLYRLTFLMQSSHAREVCFPGGKCDSHEETNAEAALRETREELGIPPDRITIWTHMPPIANHKGINYWH
jgi:8-oxo-dGTP pyrophosphatase MutT (NUDIX family)